MAICTLFDKSYAIQGTLLLRSIRRHLGESERIVVCALDSHVEALVYGFRDPCIDVISADSLERVTPALEAMRRDRSRAEWCWMLTPYLCRYTAQLYGVAEYLDADCWLVAPLDEVRAEIGDNPVAIVPHRWSPEHAERLKGNGTYNVGYLRFDAAKGAGDDALYYWCRWCAEWKPTAPGERFMDQLCLEDWPERFGAHVVQHVGLNLAPYNQEQYQYGTDFQYLYANNQRVCMYHLHEWRWGPPLSRGGYHIVGAVQSMIYGPYEQEACDVVRFA